MHFDNSHNSFLWPEYVIDCLSERWIPCQPPTSVLCLLYRPETVHCSTKDAYTSEISFLELNPWFHLFFSNCVPTFFISRATKQIWVAWKLYGRLHFMKIRNLKTGLQHFHFCRHQTLYHKILTVCILPFQNGSPVTLWLSSMELLLMDPRMLLILLHILKIKLYTKYCFVV